MEELKRKSWMLLTFILLGYILVTQIYEIDISIRSKNNTSPKKEQTVTSANTDDQTTDIIAELRSSVIPDDGVELPIVWGNLGKQMVDTGVIDPEKFREIFANELTEELENMLTGNWNKPVKITQDNSRFLLDLFWALGLGNKNKILTEGEIVNKEYGGAENFASTGGWTLAKGDVMDHYAKHEFITLTDEQQKLVEQVSQGIYRPCCGNSTYFPDCNHGMAMLGLLELMASQGVSKDQLYKTALAVNSYWFPQTYLELATFFQEQGQDWKDVDPQLALSQEYSSGQGYQATRAKIKSLPQPPSGGGGCGV